jgi:hypothetical protein
MMKIDMNKKYLSCGVSIRILCTDRNNTNFPVVGLFDDGQVHYFTEYGRHSSDAMYDLIDSFEPIQGEWYWFWDNMDGHKAVHLAKFDKKVYHLFKSADGKLWQRCTEFTGDIPDFLKEVVKDKEPITSEQEQDFESKIDEYTYA